MQGEMPALVLPGGTVGREDLRRVCCKSKGEESLVLSVLAKIVKRTLQGSQQPHDAKMSTRHSEREVGCERGRKGQGRERETER